MRLDNQRVTNLFACIQWLLLFGVKTEKETSGCMVLTEVNASVSFLDPKRLSRQWKTLLISIRIKVPELLFFVDDTTCMWDSLPT